MNIAYYGKKIMCDRSRETRILNVSLYWQKSCGVRGNKSSCETERPYLKTVFFSIQIDIINDWEKDPDLEKSINNEAGNKWNLPPNLQFQKVSLLYNSVDLIST